MPNGNKHPLIVIIALWASSLATLNVAAELPWPVRIYKVADTSTPSPLGGGPFTSFDIPTAGGFVANSPAGAELYYRTYKPFNPPEFSPIANTNTPIPGGAGAFTGFDPPSWNQGWMIFFRGHGNDQQGIYAFDPANRSLRSVADRNTLIPGASGRFQSFGSRPQAFGGVFYGSDSGAHRGLYAWNGLNTRVVADTDTGVPGEPGKKFANFGPLSRDTFVGVWDTSTAAFYGPHWRFTPKWSAGGEDGIQHLAAMDARGGGALFSLSQGGTQYVGLAPDYWGGQGQDALRIIAQTRNDLPGVPVFNAIHAIGYTEGTIEDGPMASILATDTNARRGLFISATFEPYSSSLEFNRILTVGDQLDGRTIADLIAGPDAQQYYSFVLKIEFTDGSSGIYDVSAYVPEPTPLLVAPLLVSTFSRPRRRHRDFSSFGR